MSPAAEAPSLPEAQRLDGGSSTKPVTLAFVEEPQYLAAVTPSGAPLFFWLQGKPNGGENHVLQTSSRE